MRRIVMAAVIRNDQLLLLREEGKKIWTLPGGELGVGETDAEGLGRILAEKFTGVEGFRILRHIFTAEERCPGRKDRASVSAYLVELDGLIGLGRNIHRVFWVQNPQYYALDDASWKIVNQLYREELLRNLLP